MEQIAQSAAAADLRSDARIVRRIQIEKSFYATYATQSTLNKKTGRNNAGIVKCRWSWSQGIVGRAGRRANVANAR